MLPEPLVVGSSRSGAFARMVEALETELGRKLSSVVGEAAPWVLVADRTCALKRDWPVVSRLVWVEERRRSRASGGVVCTRLAQAEEVLEHPFEAMCGSRASVRREAFDSTAARNVLVVVQRDPDSPWPAMESSTSRPIPLWRMASQSRFWSLAGLRLDSSVEWRYAATNTILADPFPIVHEGREWIYFEEQTRGSNGVLSAGLLEKGVLRELAHDILPSDTHRSWPNVFHHAGELWMIPESGVDREVAIWRCKRFPDEWVKERVLLTGSFWTDPVLHFQDGRWWLFVSASGPSGASHSDNLHLFHSVDPWTRPFAAHPWNPVSIGVVGSRPAGRILSERDGFVRPAQDCSDRYGKALVFRKILEITPERYREATVRRAEAPPGTWGIHTWNLSESGVVVDLLEGRTRLVST